MTIWKSTLQGRLQRGQIRALEAVPSVEDRARLPRLARFQLVLPIPGPRWRYFGVSGESWRGAGGVIRTYDDGRKGVNPQPKKLTGLPAAACATAITPSAASVDVGIETVTAGKPGVEASTTIGTGGTGDGADDAMGPAR